MKVKPIPRERRGRKRTVMERTSHYETSCLIEKGIPIELQMGDEHAKKGGETCSFGGE